MAQPTAYGGQAVIEGVMIRGKELVATACRKKDGSISIHRDTAEGLMNRYPILRLPILRGTPALIDSLSLGYRTLMWSADVAMEGEEELQQQKLHPAVQILTFIGSFALGIGLFVLIPTFVINSIFGHHGPQPALPWYQQFAPSTKTILPNLCEGLMRLLMLVLYIICISYMKGIKRVFAYHGAEHKVVNSWEGSGELSVETAKRYSRIHPRCGTSFLFLVFIVGIIVHALIGWPKNPLILYPSRLLLLPVVAGLAYEVLRLAGRFRNSMILRVLVWPGMLLQRLTTAEPSDDQIEVALASMRTVLEDEGVLTPESTPVASVAG